MPYAREWNYPREHETLPGFEDYESERKPVNTSCCQTATLHLNGSSRYPERCVALEYCIKLQIAVSGDVNTVAERTNRELSQNLSRGIYFVIYFFLSLSLFLLLYNRIRFD